MYNGYCNRKSSSVRTRETRRRLSLSDQPVTNNYGTTIEQERSMVGSADV